MAKESEPSGLESLTAAVGTLNDSILQMEGRLTKRIDDLETRVFMRIGDVETKLTQRINDVETKLMISGANNLEDCVNSIEAVGESIRGMITAERIRRRTQDVAINSRIEAIGKRVDALEANQAFSRP